MRTLLILPGLLGLTTAAVKIPAQPPAGRNASSALDFHLDWHARRLENGITLLLHQDTTMPEVGIEVLIRGGSREEAPGHYGTAHLFEHHLPSSGRFLGNPTNRAAWNRTRRGSGAGTEPDLLRFYLVVRPEGLEVAIGALADRLESDSTRFSDSVLATDKNVVISELRRALNIDWDTEVSSRLFAGTFGRDHPYGHPIAGTESGVNAATSQLMRDWHRRFGGAANAVVVVAGNFELERAEALVRKHFGPIAPGVAAPSTIAWVPEPRAVREVIERAVPSPYTYLHWPIPGFGERDGQLLRLLGQVYADRASRNLKVRVGVDLWEMAGVFRLRGQSTSSSEVAATHTAMKAELERLLRTGPTGEEVARARTQLLTDAVVSMQAPVWRGGRGDVLALGLLFTGDPGHYRKQIAIIQAATPEEVRAAGRRWLGKPGYELRVIPAPQRTTTGSVDRTAAMDAVHPTVTLFPPARTGTTASGTAVVFVERPQLPLTELTLAVRAGSADEDPTTATAALAAFTMLPVRSGARSLRDSIAALGGTMHTAVDADYATVTVTILSERSRAATGVLLQAIEHVSLAPRGAVVAAAVEETGRDARELRGTPLLVRDQVVDCVLYRRTDCGRLPPPATGKDRVSGLLSVRYRPENATLLASGALTERTVGGLAPPRTITVPAQTPAAAAARPDGESAWIVPFPSATQAHALLVVRLPRATAADPLVAQLVSFALRQRLMDNLRTAKGWSYEVYPFGVRLRRGLAFMRFNAPLQLDRLGEAMTEIRNEADRLATEPVSEEVLDGWKSFVEGSALSPGLTSLQAMNRQLLELSRNALSADYYATAQQRLRKITPSEFRQAALELLRRDAMTWVIAGPEEAVARELAEVGLTGTVVR